MLSSFIASRCLICRLSNQFPKYFIERELCLQQKSFAVKMIEDTLMSSSFNRKYVHGTDYIRKRNIQGDLCID